MKLAVIKEKNSTENRVAITPDIAAEYIKLGLEVHIEKASGDAAGFADDMYKQVGAKIGASASSVLANADIVLKVQPPSDANLTSIKKGASLIGLLTASDEASLINKYAENKISAFAMELLPRITRAQSMDVLSSQSNIAGYKAVVDAFAEFGKVVPMMTTAAGTIRPAKVLVLGAGVAGLQAIATAKRMGAVVSAFDVRAVVKEQVQSLGATFVEVPAESGDSETKGGYAKEMSEEYKKKQSELIAETIKINDIVICTALIPGRQAPVLVTEKMVKDMKPGSVIVDLATGSGGNCALSEKNKIVIKSGVKIIGYDNMPSRVPYDSSRLYSKNLFNFVQLIVDSKLGSIKLDLEDEIIKGCLLTHNGEIVHPNYKPSK